MTGDIFTKTDWTRLAAIASQATGRRYDRKQVYTAANSYRVSRPLSAALAGVDARKVCWRSVAEHVSRYFDQPLKPRYAYEVAKGWRRNNKIRLVLEKLGVIDLMNRLEQKGG